MANLTAINPNAIDAAAAIASRHGWGWRRVAPARRSSATRGERVSRRQIDQLGAPTDQKLIEADEERVWRRAHKSFEGRIDLAAGARIEYLNL
jgi:hypothetical protein